MRRMLTIMTGALVMAAMMVAMAMPAFAWHNHVLSTGECGNKGQVLALAIVITRVAPRIMTRVRARVT